MLHAQQTAPLSTSGIQRSNHGRFIVLEGGDGAGKSTIINYAESRLRSTLDQVTVLRPKKPDVPDGYLKSHLAKISEILWEGGQATPRHLIPDLHWLYLAASWYVILDAQVVRPALSSGSVVIADSWTDKLLARFRIKNEALAREAQKCFSMVSRPDKVIFLDGP